MRGQWQENDLRGDVGHAEKSGCHLTGRDGRDRSDKEGHPHPETKIGAIGQDGEQ